MNKQISVKIKGYWREQAVNGLPSHSGVYFVYAGKYQPLSDTVVLEKLIYIGESSDVKKRVLNHEKWNDWRKHLGSNQELCFSTGYISSIDRIRTEAAYINKHKPVENVEYKYNFPFMTTTISSSGDIALLTSYFTVFRTMRQGLYI